MLQKNLNEYNRAEKKTFLKTAIEKLLPNLETDAFSSTLKAKPWLAKSFSIKIPHNTS
jgi:hypothetical protein